MTNLKDLLFEGNELRGRQGPQGLAGSNGITGDAGSGIGPFEVKTITSEYTLSSDDIGKLLKINSGGSSTGINTITISSSTFSFGDVFLLFNETSPTQKISPGVGVTFYSSAGEANTTGITISENDLYTILCLSSNEFTFSGTSSMSEVTIVEDGLVLNLDAGDTDSYPGSGTTWFDLSGNGRNATINGSPTFANGYFDITSDSTYISISNSGLVPRTNDFTYSTWINFDSFDGSDTIFENGSWTDTLLFRHQSNIINVYAESALAGSFSWTPSAGVWYNVVFKRESGTCSMYINNTLTGTPFTMTTDINLANTNLFLMRSQHTTGQFLDGKIAIFSIYNRSLSAQEIQQNYDALKSRFQ